ncbi:MAG: hypothetical protein ACLPX9_05280 [Rhodomicrobium sp.]
MTSPGESTSRLSDGQLLDWLRLIRSENIGPRGITAQTPHSQSAAGEGGGAVRASNPVLR